MKMFCIVALCSMTIATVGCTATPSVTYAPIVIPSSSDAKGDPSGSLKFVLPRSLIFLNRKDVKDQATQLSATSVPTDNRVEGETVRLFSITPDSPWGVETHLNITYIDNTRIVSSIGTSVEDNRVKYIGEIVGIVTTIVKAAAVLGPVAGAGPDMPDHLPAVIDPRAYEARTDRAKWQTLPRNASVDQEPNMEWVYRLDIGEVGSDAMVSETFFAAHAKKTDLFPYSACRDATLYLLKSKSGDGDEARDRQLDKAFVFGLKLADSRNVMLVSMPAKGKVDAHTACGVNVTSEKSDTSSTWAIIGELVKQAGAVKQAYDDQKKGASGGGQKPPAATPGKPTTPAK